MALPRLNEVPHYEMVIPSTKEVVKYRPFLVKEQKILMIAIESKDTKQILSAITNTINACCEGVDANKLANFDVDYMFTQIRSKAVGETTKLQMICNKCEHKNAVEVFLEQTKLSSEPKDSVIKLDDNISVKMKYPTYNDIKNNATILNTEASPTEIAFETIRVCMHAILTEEEQIILSDEPQEEVQRFIESLTTSQFEKLSSFMKDMPKLLIDIDYKCESCGTVNERTITGLEDFFF